MHLKGRSSLCAAGFPKVLALHHTSDAVVSLAQSAVREEELLSLYARAFSLSLSLSLALHERLFIVVRAHTERLILCHAREGDSSHHYRSHRWLLRAAFLYRLAATR